MHSELRPLGQFRGGDARFWSSGTGTAHDADDRVIYNTAHRAALVRRGRQRRGRAQLIATLEGDSRSDRADIDVINGSERGGGGGSTINGTSGNDTLTGTAGNDTINGLGGNDLFVAGSTGGADVIDGGAGTDSIEFRDRATSGVVVDFGAGTITGGSSGTISFTGIERVVASNFADSLTGAAGGQTLTGQGGADTLWGRRGVDTLWGGGGNDAFVFREMGSANADRVSDFASGADKMQLDDAAFTSIGAMGNFAAGDARFWASAGGAAHDANDRVIYNTSTGQLYYDADGSGAGAAQLVATLHGAPGGRRHRHRRDLTQHYAARTRGASPGMRAGRALNSRLRARPRLSLQAVLPLRRAVQPGDQPAAAGAAAVHAAGVRPRARQPQRARRWSC